MIWRLLSIPVLAWALGFAGFVLLLPGPADERATDAIVVPTGGAGRIPRGIALLEAGKAERMLITGVDRRVLPHELAIAHDASPALFETKVELGREAVDTRSNALEAAQWIRRRGYRSVRLVTTDWHMPRARFELQAQLGDGVALVPDAVPSRPGFKLLLVEYNKYLLRRAAALVGI